MKSFYGYNFNQKINPDAWYKNFNCFDNELSKHEPYEFFHKFKDKTNIKYQIDEYGFRNKNTIDSKLWFFGCSFTFGLALEIEKTFPILISNILKTSYYNFGTPGASIDLITRLLYKLKEKIYNKKIIIILPRIERFETVKNNNYINLTPYHEEYLEYLSLKNPHGDIEYKLIKNIMFLNLIKNSCDMHLFTFVENKLLQDNLKVTLIPKNLCIDTAKDNEHFGEITNKNIAKFISKNL